MSDQQEPSQPEQRRRRSHHSPKSMSSRGRERSRKRANKGTNRPRGHPAFKPTRAERMFVSCMAGLRLTGKEIAAVLGSGRGGGPLSKATLYRHFGREMKNGGALLRAKISGNYYRALEREEAWATQLGLRNRFAWSTGTGVAPPLAALGDEGVSDIRAFVEFVVPGHATPAETEVEMPIPEERRLPPPREMRRNSFGIWEEAPPNDGRPRKPGDWMG
jgi:hypothetical protein